LSNDEATDWLIDYICNHITENGVDIYRQDCNLNGGASLKSYWQSIEEEGRKGYVENRYIINYLRYFDAILEHTGTYIDNCASGGKRLDLESTKRSVALWRDDNNKGPIIAQCQSWGINFYMPYSGHGIYVNDKYASRSELFTSNGYTFTPMEQNHEGQVAYKKEFIDESLAYAPFLTQDYYPLTPFNDTENTWMAWQFNDYKTSTGIIQVFKRGESTETTQTYYLSGLDANASYIVTDIDTNEPAVFTGLELMTNGFTVNIEEVYTAKIFTYKPV
jgi:alpha-galactosidase